MEVGFHQRIKHSRGRGRVRTPIISTELRIFGRAARTGRKAPDLESFTNLKNQTAPRFRVCGPIRVKVMHPALRSGLRCRSPAVGSGRPLAIQPGSSCAPREKRPIKLSSCLISTFTLHLHSFRFIWGINWSPVLPGVGRPAAAGCGLGRAHRACGPIANRRGDLDVAARCVQKRQHGSRSL